MKKIRLRKENGRIKSIVFGDTLEIYFSFGRLRFEYCTSFYFDQRHLLNTSVTILIGVLGLIFTHLNWWSFIWVLFIAIPYGKIFLHFPWKSKRPESYDWPQYGFYFDAADHPWYYSSELVLCYGMKDKRIYLPWSWEWVRTSVFMADGTWEHETKNNRKNFWEEKWKEFIHYETHPYTYILKNGTVQNRLATCRIEEREWRWIWFMKFKWPAKISKTLSVEFNDEVGERTGSWKGGTIGCGYKMLPNETILTCLRRMEAERVFR